MVTTVLLSAPGRLVQCCEDYHRRRTFFLFTRVRGETVWKIAGRPLEGALLAPGGANRLLFAPSWRPYSPRFGTHSEFPNSFGRKILRSWATYLTTGSL